MRHHDGCCCACILGGSDGARSASDDDVNFQPNKLICEFWVPSGFASCRPKLKNNVPTLDVTEIPQPLHKCFGRSGANVSQITYVRNFLRLLRLSWKDKSQEHRA